ncbi:MULTISPECIES: peptidoglycan D,D-transpeptidase FtsI family protein [unclassified Microbacterium]|uniref:peptidoglycan D,D-transpeptidase FtsI family protein n=1 Tax=unclassified Microbacterium TaxID=2609290 RepID=UPI000B34D80F|nr:penicillin-binding protein 2 [Microbacterium sp. JB110]RCS63246.1 penicillin-binding protein 2 [Microbacterium sp. JB110]
MSSTQGTSAARSPRRRTVVALACVVVIILAFVVRLVDIQVVSASEHLDEASDKGLNGSRTLYGVRGSIVDANGQTLASSTQLYDANIDPKLAVDMTTRDDEGNEIDVPFSTYAPDIAEVLGRDAEDIEKIVDEAIAIDPDDRWERLARNITTTQYVDLVELGLPFITYEPKPARSYPAGSVAGNLLGFVGSDGPQAGYERIENECLASTNGKETFQQSPSGVRIPGTENVDSAADGGTLQLTIDSDLQWYLQEMIAEEVQSKKAEWGSVTVVDAETGAIRAAAEAPSIDPNDVNASDPADRGSRIFRTTYEPGSTFKAITAAMLLDAGKATPSSTEYVPTREYFDNGAVVNDAAPHPDYHYTLAGVLIDSSNVGISKFGDRLSMPERHDYLEAFGVGSRTSVGFGGEESGLLRSADDWDNQTRYATSFGQAFTVTAPQVAGAYQALANDGVKLPVHLVESCTLADGTVVEPDLPEAEQIVSEKTADQVMSLIENVAVQGGNTVDVPGYRVGIKTGTAQKSDGNGGYKPGVYATSIVGVAPIDDPQYVVIVTLDEPKTIRSSAATVSALEKSLNQVLKTYRVTPSSGEPTLYPKTK